MHNPPAPVFGHHQMGFLTPHEAGTEKQAYRYDRDDHEENDGATIRLPQSGPQRPQNENDPEQQADREKHLPEASEIDILPALMAKPVIHGQVWNEAIDRGPLTYEAADNDDQQAGKQEIYAPDLERGVSFRQKAVRCKGRPPTMLS